MNNLRLISIVLLSIMIIFLLKSAIKDIKYNPTIGNILTWFFMLTSLFVPYLYISLK